MNVVRMLIACTLILIGLLFAYFTVVVFSVEVLPALREGTVAVTTSARILNRLWEGNEIYVLLLGYSGVAVGLTAAGFVLARNALQRIRG